MVLADNFERKLQAIISDIPYKYYGLSYYGLSEIMACNFCSKLPANTIYYSGHKSKSGHFNRNSICMPLINKLHVEVKCERVLVLYLMLICDLFQILHLVSVI